ncbi:lanthionine synthetase LanC family protein [Proteiniphilum sp.]|uniref:lanthionine synthetase LanC family protein n=1 Tax=Proteiniphilum sp. TaxID=1926877 RepID=UPI0033315EB9
MNKFSFLQPFADALLNRRLSDELGLWNGKMGIAITLFHLSRITQKKEYERQANDLVDEVYNKISNQISYDFAEGLLGIGCGLEYLLHKRFVEGNSDDILLEIDLLTRNIIDMRLMDSLDFGKGVGGIGYYIYCRLRNKSEEEEGLATLKLKEYLIYLIDWLEELLSSTGCEIDYMNTYFLLCRLWKLEVFNYKVEKLTSFCLEKMIKGNCDLHDHYVLLGIPSLIILKPWI